jgi:Lipocalin-like domain
VSENEVIHHLRVCSFENWVGTDQQRSAQLNKDALTLSTAPRLLLGKQGIGRLTWKRATTFK